MKVSRWLYQAVFMISDLVLGFSVALLAFIIRHDLLPLTNSYMPVMRQWQPIRDLDFYLPVFMVMGLLLILVLYFKGIFAFGRVIHIKNELVVMAKNVSLAMVIILIVSFFLRRKGDWARGLILLTWGLLIIALTLWHVILYRLFHKRIEKGKYNALVVGGVKEAGYVKRVLEKYMHLPFRYIGVVNNSRIPGANNLNYLGKVTEVDAVVRRHNIEYVFLALPSGQKSLIHDIISYCEDRRIKIRIMSDAFHNIASRSTFSTINRLLFFDLGEIYYSTGYSVFRRFVEYPLAVFLFLWVLPFCALIAALIKLDSKGPVFFTQERVGFRGEIFTIFKFRTMVSKTNPYARTVRDTGDARVTPLGRFLRRTSLDEFPQFLNVLRGDMSLIGPRPEMPFLVEKYSAVERRRLLLKPGLTGLWQVCGRSNKPLDQNVKYDLYYLRKKSICLDLWIMIMTLPTVLFGRGAY